MIVEVKNVRKTYDNGVEALRDVNLAFPQGKLTTLLGPSGCGKTTLLKIIAGLIPRNGGEVLVKGKPVDGPGTVSRIVKPEVDRAKSPDEIRRDRNYLDTVDEIWGMLRQYV